jgi:hypothetical protein
MAGKPSGRAVPGVALNLRQVAIARYAIRQATWINRLRKNAALCGLASQRTGRRGRPGTRETGRPPLARPPPGAHHLTRGSREVVTRCNRQHDNHVPR